MGTVEPPLVESGRRRSALAQRDGRRMQRLSAEEREVIARAKHGTRLSSSSTKSRSRYNVPAPAPASYRYPSGVSPKTLGLLGRIDALMKAEPQPPKWALLRVLSMLEEEREKA